MPRRGCIEEYKHCIAIASKEVTSKEHPIYSHLEQDIELESEHHNLIIRTGTEHSSTHSSHMHQ